MQSVQGLPLQADGPENQNWFVKRYLAGELQAALKHHPHNRTNKSLARRPRICDPMDTQCDAITHEESNVESPNHRLTSSIIQAQAVTAKLSGGSFSHGLKTQSTQ